MTELVVTTPDGAKLRARRHGQGQPLVLVSGLGGTAGFWDPAIALLGSEFELITFDQRGIAGSSWTTIVPSDLFPEIRNPNPSQGNGVFVFSLP